MKHTEMLDQFETTEGDLEAKNFAINGITQTPDDMLVGMHAIKMLLETLVSGQVCKCITSTLLLHQCNFELELELRCFCFES